MNSPLAATYRLFGRLWLHEVDGDFWRQLCAPPMADAFRDAGGSLPSDPGLETLDALSIDYCQLFVGPANHLPPVQSVWQYGRFQGQPADSMRRYLSVVGGDAERFPIVDHLGVQLEVMGRLLMDADEARLEDGDQQSLRDLQQDFFRDHLSWPDRLLDMTVQRASTSFYRSLAEMTRGLIQLGV